MLLSGAALCVLVRHRHRHRDRHIHAFGLSGAADQLFRESAAHHRFGRDHSGGGDSGLAAAAGQINPIRHFSVIARSSMIKGSGMETLWPNFLVLAIFTFIMVSLSVWRFRKQLS